MNIYDITYADTIYSFEIVGGTKYDGKNIDLIIKDIVKSFKLSNKGTERNFVVALDEDGYAVGVFQSSKGDYKKCEINARQIFLFLLSLNVKKYILIHNHPSQEHAELSLEDKTIYLNMQVIGATIAELTIVDSFCIAKDGYCGQKEFKQMKWD